MGRNIGYIEKYGRCSISTHTPRVGRNLKMPRTALPVMNFYSHAPSGAQQYNRATVIYKILISTHTPRVGRNDYNGVTAEYHEKFLLTRPEWGATHIKTNSCSFCAISTHTPRVGRNNYARDMWAKRMNFYSHAPSGAQPAAPQA